MDSVHPVHIEFAGWVEGSSSGYIGGNRMESIIGIVRRDPVPIVIELL